MKRIFIAIFLILFSIAQTYAKDISFIQITDLDLSSKNASKAYALMKEINDRKNIDFVVFTGNNLKSASFENLKTFTKILKKLNKRTYVLIGNQDVSSSSGMDKEFYYKKVRNALYLRHPKVPNFYFEKENYIFIAMDGSKQYFKSANGYYTKKELMWLSDILDKAIKKNKKIVLMQHFPLIETNLEWKNTYNVEEYKKIIDKYNQNNNIKAIISGHYNQNIEKLEGNIKHIITPAFSNNYAYKLIQIDLEDDSIYTFLVK